MRRFMMGLSGVSVSLLVACGGGGSDAPAGPFNVAAAWQNALTTQRTYHASASVDGNTISLDMQIQPLAASTYPPSGVATSRVDQTVIARINGGNDVTDHVVVHYTGDANVIGHVNDDGTCSDVTTNLPLPTAADMGAHGSLYRAIDHADCSGGAATGSGTEADWLLQSEQGVDYFCVYTTEEDTNGALIGRVNECVEVHPDGTLGSRVRVTVEIPGEPLLVLRGS